MNGPSTFGEAEPLGVSLRGDGVNVAVFSANADAIEFCLFESDREVRRVRLRGRTGDVFHDHIAEVSPGAKYGLRAHGPFLPNEGHRFNPNKLLLDPYAAVIDRPFRLHQSMFGYRTDAPDGGRSFDNNDSAPFMPKGIVRGPTVSSRTRGILTSWPDTVIYELHVRGFTMRHPDIPETIRGRFAGLAHPMAIEHLVRLGVTSVEIMPAAAWIEERHLAALGLRNYWGYNPVTFMAPDPGLAPDDWDEIRAAVAALAEAGIETILDVVLNHTGEGDALGPTLSLRGLDNATYYRLTNDGQYVDDTGCGNTMALDRRAPLRLAMDALRQWAECTGLHGFRFDLATTLGRRADGFDPAAPLLSSIAQDPLLRELKLVAEPWDVGSGGHQLGCFPPTWGEWNDRFRDGVRRFWHGDPGMLGELATRLAGSSDIFGARGVTSRSVNFVVAHDGFTLGDLVSYSYKENHANGECNRDGTDANFSWNNGVEGRSDDAEIMSARQRDQRALLATLILARGTPMLSMGSELGHSQTGNNNAYAQDNSSSWLDWANADVGLLDWTREILQVRRRHSLLRGDHFLTGRPFDISLLPDVEWRDAADQAMTPDGWRADGGDTLKMILAVPDRARDGTERLCVIFHRGRAGVTAVLPRPRVGHAWRLVADSARSPPDPTVLDTTNSSVVVAARSVQVLVEEICEPRVRSETDPNLLERLARAASIAPEWWDVMGRRTVVSDDTRRVLLAAMRLPAATDAEVRDSLRMLSTERDRRALPVSLTVRSGDVPVLQLAAEKGLRWRPIWLSIEHEDGSIERLRFATDDGALVTRTGIDGLPVHAWSVSLPMLPEGRYRVRRDEVPGAVCYLTVAPRRCFLPEAIRGGAKRFGITAQLYALRRENDQGIGDFATLGQFAERAALERASVVGINPLHMLFPTDRERASPYYPSDRRFLDPIYLDVAGSTIDARPEQNYGSPSGRIAWSNVWARKLPALEADFAGFIAREQAVPTAGDAFRRFVAQGGASLRQFAIFQTIAESRPDENWRQWPAGLRVPDGEESDRFAARHAERVAFHQYLQYRAEQQFAAAASHAARSGLELGYYRDLAVGAAPDGAESWSRADELADGAWIGAPPDPFAVDGQNWHLPPPIPSRLALAGFAGFASLIAANMRHAGALRIDHAMGLTRLFWIPDGGRAADGAYVAYPFEDLLGQIALESVRARCLVVGEDLGTVPEDFRPVMRDADILSYRVLLLEREGRAFRAAKCYPDRAVVCVSTHDLPPLAGWWEGVDIQERAALGLVEDGDRAMAERKLERETLVEALADAGCLIPPMSGELAVAEVVASAHAFVASAPAELALVQAEDLAEMRVGVNLPGTDKERPNWRFSVPVPVEALFNSVVSRSILNSVRATGRGVAAGSEAGSVGHGVATEDG